MSNHLSMRSGNPALQASTFKKHLTSSVESKMTLSGTVNKTGISLLLVIISAGYTWGNPSMHIMMIPAGIVGFILALATVFKPTIGHITVPAYAVAQGILLGVISMYFNAMYPGIVVQAVFLTFGTLGALLLAYKSGLIAATENFKLGIFSATFGILIIYVLNLILSLFGVSFMGPLFGNGLTGILFSLFVIGIASLNLVLDFDFIENGAEQGAPKYMEWYAAFGLMITLIWLYIEILNLLMKLRSRR